MNDTPGFWAYALGTGAAIGLQLALVSLLQIRGHADVALMIGMIAGAAYLITPAPRRGDAKRLWTMIFLALGAMMLSSALGALWGVAMAPLMIGAAMRAGEGLDLMPGLVLGLTVLMGAGAYLALFRFGWRFVKPPECAAPPATWTQLFR